LQGLVMPGVAAVDEVSFGREAKSDLDPGVRGVALAVNSSIDWKRFEELRARSTAGAALSPAESEELARLEETSLGLAIEGTVRAIDVQGVRTVLLDKTGKASIRANIARMDAERIDAAARISAGVKARDVPTELAALAAMDSGDYRARVETLSAVVERASSAPEGGVSVPDVGAAGGGAL